MLEKEHTNIEGIQKIVDNRASMSWDLSNELKQVFPNMDSASAIIMDTARAAAYVAKCK